MPVAHADPATVRGRVVGPEGKACPAARFGGGGGVGEEAAAAAGRGDRRGLFHATRLALLGAG